MNTATPQTFEQAADQLRAAQLAKQLRGDASTIFVHAPRPATVPTLPEHQWQRTFGPGKYGRADQLKFTAADSSALNGAAEVFRNAAFDYCDLRLSLGLCTTASVQVCMGAPELRELAARLIDAAHDLEACPAAVLAKASAAATTQAEAA